MTTGLYRSVYSKLLTAHQNVNENLLKVLEIINSNSNKTNNEFKTNPIIETSNSTRHTRVENKKDDNTEDNLYDNCIDKYIENDTNKNKGHKEITIDDDKKPMHNYKKLRK
ncbi:31814_t:CDS:1, partial [Gigaspora margarita]